MTLRDSLRERASGIGARIVLPEGNDSRIQQAAEQLAKLGIANPVLLTGDFDLSEVDETHTEIAELIRSRRPQAVRDGFDALELATDPIRHGVGLVAVGKADGCVAGAVVPTSEVVRAALWLVGMRPGIAAVTSAMYHGMPDGRVFTYADIAVIPKPTAEQLAGAAIAAADDRTILVGDVPVVAFLSYSTKGSASGEGIERIREALTIFQRERPGVVSDGELQVDAALDSAVAERKAPDSPVAGNANILVFPDLNSANIGYKLTQRLAGATAAGPLLQGLAAPISDLSRGAEVDDIVDVAAMVALLSEAAKSENPQEL